ncbi:MAG TPA: hypothetical protein VKV15_13110 [Bryobacteraceae bacterium]|nr:hypothetical protein [Bryobacteraceae bacterium]
MVGLEKKSEPLGKDEHGVLDTSATLGPLGCVGWEGAVALLGELPPQPLRTMLRATAIRRHNPASANSRVLGRADPAMVSEDIRAPQFARRIYFDIICPGKSK